MIRHFIFMVLSLIGILVNPFVVGPPVRAFLGIVIDGPGLLVFYLFYTFFYWGAVTRTGGTPFWLGSIFAAIVGGAEGSCIFLVVYAGILSIVVIFLQILLFGWHFFCLVCCLFEFLFARGRTGGGVKFFTKILHLVIYIIDSVFKFFVRIFHRVIRIFIDPDPDPEQREKVQRRNVWALSLWGDLGRVEIVPPHTNTPWKMSPERYKRICSDVSAVDTAPFEITSPVHGAGEMWYIIPEGGTDFVILLDKKPIRGKTPINAGNKVALWRRRKGTVIGRLDVKRRRLVETKGITSSRMKR